MSRPDASQKAYLLKIKVVPGSSRTKVDGWLGESLKIRVAAKPEKGQANEAVLSLLADTLRIPKKNICISSGVTSPKKMLKISGITGDLIHARLAGRDA